MTTKFSKYGAITIDSGSDDCIEFKTLLLQCTKQRYVMPKFPKNTVFYIAELYDVPIAEVTFSDGSCGMYRFDTCPPRHIIARDASIVTFDEFRKCVIEQLRFDGVEVYFTE